MFKINDIKHPSFEIADYIEFCALKNSDGTCSIAGLRAALSAPEDEIDINGTEEGDDAVLNKLSKALVMNSERKTVFGGYPFNISMNSLSCKSELTRNDYYYIFLLLANRLNMQSEKIQGGQNATDLFERLCRCVISEYLGGHCKCEVVGTNGSFEIKVNEILNKMDLKGYYREPDGGTEHHKDGGVDIIAWLPFEDRKDSQLIALGQCKTGTNWEPFLKKNVFFKTYTTCLPYVDPEYLYFFFVAEDFGKYKWEERSRAAGVLFDRRRILACIPVDISSIDAQLDADIHTWVNAALQYIRANS